MRPPALVVLLALVLTAGCAAPPNATSGPAPSARLVPDRRLQGVIATVNAPGQFVVVDFNVGAIPPLQTRLKVYRASTVVGTIRLSGPVRDHLVAADIVAGEAGVGDRAIWDPEPVEPRDGPAR